MSHDQELHSATGQTMAWQESDSQLFVDFGRVLTPARHEIARTLVDLVPAQQDEPFLFVDVGAGQGWLSAAVLQHFQAARAILLDGSQVMRDKAAKLLAPFADRVELRPFQIEDATWPAGLAGDIRCFLSSLVIHHLDGAQKRALFETLYRRLSDGGALLIADLVEPGSEWERRHMARAWDDVVKRQSLEYLGDLRAYEFFVREHWNIYDYPDPMDKPSPLLDQLRWLEQAGFRDVGVFWAHAGHAVYGGYKRASV